MDDKTVPTTAWAPLSEDVQRRLLALREPVPEAEIVYTPKMACRTCKKLNDPPCERHQKLRQCANCHSYNCSSGHVDIPGISHPFVEQRFFDADPAYRIEFIGADQNGFPIITYTGEGPNKKANLWGTIHICGIERSEVGTVDANTPDLHKQLISDLIKRLGLRLGIASELRGQANKWATEARSNGASSPAAPRPAAPAARTAAPAAPAPAPVSAPAPSVGAEDVAKWVGRIAATKTVAELRTIQNELRDPAQALIRSASEVRDAFVARANVFKFEQAQKAVENTEAAVSEDPEDEADDAVELPTPRRGRPRKAA